jgi:hypothetical protein
VSERSDRDRALERAVGQALRRPGDARGQCPDGETVAAWAAHTLGEAEAASVEAHLSSCRRCQALVAVFARTEAEPVAAGASLWQRWRLQWLVPAAAAATALALWVALPDDSGRPASPVSEVASGPAPAETAGPTDTQMPAPAPTQAPADVEPSAASPQPVGASADRFSDARQTVPSAEPVAPAAPGAAPAVRQQGQTALADQAAAKAEEAARSPRAETESAAGLEVRAAPPPPPRQDATLERNVARAPALMVEIVSPQPATRWRIRPDGQVERSTTGGAAWESVATGAPAAFTAGSSPDPSVCWLVGSAGAIRVTTDGVRFREVRFPQRLDLVMVTATSAASAVVTAADGRRFRTEDQGTTWTAVAP